MAQLLEELCLDDEFFFRLLQDEGQQPTRSSTGPNAQCVHFEGLVYKNVWLAANQLYALTLMAIDKLDGLFPRWPKDPVKCTTQLGLEIFKI